MFIHVYIYICVFICVYNLYMCLSIYICLNMFTYVYKCLYMIICVYICLYVFIYVYMCLYMFIYKCIYIYIYIYMCVCVVSAIWIVQQFLELPRFLRFCGPLKQSLGESCLLFLLILGWCSVLIIIWLIWLWVIFKDCLGCFLPVNLHEFGSKLVPEKRMFCEWEKTVNLWVPKLHDVWTILKSLILTPIVSHDCLL